MDSNDHSASRRRVSRRLLSVLAVAVFVASPLRAGDVQVTIEGVVRDLETDLPATLVALNALGLAEGATASVTYTIDPDAAGIAQSPGAKVYLEALVDMVVQVGDWQLGQDLEQAFPTVTVGNNVSDGNLTGDVYTLTTGGSDTSDLLAGDGGPGSVDMLLICIDFNGNASKNAKPKQDASKYDLVFGTVGGDTGSFDLEFPGSGGTGLCTKGLLLASARYGRTVFFCKAKSAQQPPSVDPLGIKEAACLEKAALKLEKQIIKAVIKAFKKGGSCADLGAGSDDLDETVLAMVDTVEADVLVGVDTGNKLDRSFRARLIRAAGAQWAKDAAAYARDALKPNPDKLQAKLAQALAKTTLRVDKAIAAAQKKGIVYDGPDGAALGQAVRSAVEGVAVLMSGGP